MGETEEEEDFRQEADGVRSTVFRVSGGQEEEEASPILYLLSVYLLGPSCQS